MDSRELKHTVRAEVDKLRPALAELSRNLHGSPEVAFEEVKAAGWLTSFLEEHGFTVARGICDLPTAFDGRYGQGKPVIAFLAEYDALPRLGHACGHNLIATASLGAGAAACRAVDALGGGVAVIGTPGEELYGGKAIMAERGAFRDIDAAMIVHPGNESLAAMQTLACQTLYVDFFGRAAHAAARPEAGINALEAMLLSFNAVNSLRQHVRDRARIHGIITDGGEAANIVPAHTAACFIVRAEVDSYLDELKEKVISCFAGAATATGARLEYRWGETYNAMVNNMTLAGLFRSNLEALGREIDLGADAAKTFSTDVGNVSRLVPTIQPLVAITSSEVLLHSPEFAEAAASNMGLEVMLDAAGAMAMTAVDLLADAATAEVVRREFYQG